ncbi:putative X8 domain-containing protein [Helianthus anomalus]
MAETAWSIVMVEMAVVGDAGFDGGLEVVEVNGADCAKILPNAACFKPNTVKDHCNYVVNGYYKQKNQVPGSCDFAGTTSVSQTTPPGNSFFILNPFSSVILCCSTCTKSCTPNE